jgi:ATP-dependent exoDNAse (exonuclease V) alpha subunit
MFAITGHKSQGKTYERGLVIGSLESAITPGHRPPPAPPQSYAYVVFSRVKRLDRLWLLRPLSDAVIARIRRKDKDREAEMVRLQQLQEELQQALRFDEIADMDVD